MKDYSNYHNINTNSKISHDGLLLLEKSLNGFESHEVLINNSITPSKILIFQKWDANYETKKVIGRIEDIAQGNLMKIGDLNWLVTTFPEDNKIYRKAEMRLCNSTFPIKSNKTRVLIGYDDLGRPVYREEYKINKQVPCVIQSKTNNSMSTDEQIYLPNGEIEIILQYQLSDTLQLNYEFIMYGHSYQIIDIDYTKVINNKGILIVRAKRM